MPKISDNSGEFLLNCSHLFQVHFSSGHSVVCVLSITCIIISSGLKWFKTVLEFCLDSNQEQGIHRHQTPPRYRTHRSLWPNMTSSIKSEVHKYRNAARGGLSHGHRGSAQKIVKIGPAVLEICWQTDRQTNN